MSNLRFAIGDSAWHAAHRRHEKKVSCPDCGGTGRLRVIFHDETVVSIDCENCSRGYLPPTGQIATYDAAPYVEQVRIGGFEVGPDGVTWKVNMSGGEGGYSYIGVRDEELFDTEDAAKAYAEVLAAQAAADESKRMAAKEKAARSWAWNASYHRKEIKEAQRRIEYHTQKLNVAAIKAKEQSP